MMFFPTILLGNGKLKPQLRAALESEGLLIIEGRLQGSIHYRHFKAPGRRSHGKVTLERIALAISEQRLAVYSRSGRAKHAKCLTREPSPLFLCSSRNAPSFGLPHGLYQRALKVSEAAGADDMQIEKIRTAIATARSTAGPSKKAAPAEISAGLFLREGDYWTISYAGNETRLKDIKGLRYIAQLLKVPGREVHVLELAATVEGGLPVSTRRTGEDDLMADGLGDAGNVLDATAKAAYKRRLKDLREELEEAQGFNDPERAARAQEEIDALVNQLAAGVGLGGRDRKAASQAERARVNITKSVKDALKRIDENHGPLGEHFRTTIRTGVYCAYLPDPRLQISWRT